VRAELVKMEDGIGTTPRAVVALRPSWMARAFGAADVLASVERRPDGKWCHSATGRVLVHHLDLDEDDQEVARYHRTDGMILDALEYRSGVTWSKR
jgi:hypothetical protein